MQRLVAHAEEVAYNDPPSGTAEQLILNQHLDRLLRHNRLSAFQRFVQQVSPAPCASNRVYEMPTRSCCYLSVMWHHMLFACKKVWGRL